MQEPDDQRLVDKDALSFPDLNEMEQATDSSAVTESTVNLTEDDSEGYKQFSVLNSLIPVFLVV